ncbi:hypothetical protein NFI96_012637, partial [Prochilodus magdalenae]
SRAFRLQRRWQEVSEWERRAQLHNRKLLQDFQRAQETLCDLVARTEAMNKIRLEYERCLEENFPQWQQKLKDKRLSEQRKRIEEHLKACVQLMEEDQRRDRCSKSPARTNSSSSISPDLSYPPIAHPAPSEYKDKRREDHVRMPRSTLSRQDNKQNIQGKVYNSFQPPSVPSTWLTRPSVTEHPRNNIPKETKTFQNIHQALNSPLLLPGDPHQAPHPTVQQETPYNHHLRQYLNPWAGEVQWDHTGDPWSVLPFVNPLVWRMMSVSDSTAEGMQCSERAEEEKQMKGSSVPQVGKHQGKKHRRRVRSSDHTSEQDSNSAYLSSNHGDSTEGGILSCEDATSFASGMQRRRNERKGKKQTYKSTAEKGTVSQSSSSTSHVCSGKNSEKDTSSPSSPVRKTFRNGRVSKAKVTSTAGVESPKHPEETKQESKSIQDTYESSPSATEKKRRRKMGNNKKKGTEKKDHKDQEGTVSEGVERCLSKDGESKGEEGEERDGPGHNAQDEEELCEGLCDKSNSGGDRDVDDKALSRNTSEGGSLSEKLEGYVGERVVDDGGEEKEEDEGDDKDEGKEEEEDVGEEEDRDGVQEERDDSEEEEEEEEEGEEEEEDGGEDNEKEEGEEEEAEEISMVVRAPRRSKGCDDESDEEANGSEVAASGLGISRHDSLKELYKDEETEDEELYDQEIEDDIEDDDDDVVVEKAHPWSCDPAYDHTKYQNDDYDDDVEGLLAPQNNVQHDQANEEEDTIKPKDLHSDSGEDSSHRTASLAPVKDEPQDSDDEFDHFYD